MRCICELSALRRKHNEGNIDILVLQGLSNGMDLKNAFDARAMLKSLHPYLHSKLDCFYFVNVSEIWLPNLFYQLSLIDVYCLNTCKGYTLIIMYEDRARQTTLPFIDAQKEKDFSKTIAIPLLSVKLPEIISKGRFKPL